jgi:hypothetical protein
MHLYMYMYLHVYVHVHVSCMLHVFHSARSPFNTTRPIIQLHQILILHSTLTSKRVSGGVFISTTGPHCQKAVREWLLS